MKQFQLFIKKNSETEMKKIADTKNSINIYEAKN